MTMKKARKGIDIFLEGKKELISNLEQEVRDHSNDVATNLGGVLITSLKFDVDFLKMLKLELEPKSRS